MPRTIRDLMPSDLEFQMFVLDELADELIENEGADVLKLTIGVTELPMPNVVLDSMVETLHDRDFIRRVYPEGLPELREAIAAFYNRKHHAGVSADRVIVNTGSSPIFRNVFQLVSGPEYEIMIPRPYYALYLYCAKLAGAAVKFYDIDVDTKRVDMDSFRANFSPERTSLVVINSPGNPVGNVVTPSEMREMYDIIDDNAYLLNDEIYNNTMFYEDFHSPLALLPEHADMTIVTNSFSKGYRMYTKRIGFALLPQELQTNLRVIQQHTLLCADPAYQYGMIAALEDEDSPAELNRVYRSRAEYTTERLTGTGCERSRATRGSRRRTRSRAARGGRQRYRQPSGRVDSAARTGSRPTCVRRGLVSWSTRRTRTRRRSRRTRPSPATSRRCRGSCSIGPHGLANPRTIGSRSRMPRAPPARYPLSGSGCC